GSTGTCISTLVRAARKSALGHPSSAQLRTRDPFTRNDDTRRADCTTRGRSFMPPIRAPTRLSITHSSTLKGGRMTKTLMIFGAAGALLAAPIAFAQSSGNFDAAVNPTVCTLNSSTGNLSPLCAPTADGTECVLLDTTIKTSNGSGVSLLITPSAVTGLFTSTKLSSTVNTANADIGIKVCVQVAGGHVLPNNAPNAPDTSCLVYDQRFQQ